MSGRRANNIRGPRSALTDFLAANNISAAQIRDQHAERIAEAVQDGAAAQPHDALSAEAAQATPATAHDEELARGLAELEGDEEEAGASSSKKRKRTVSVKDKTPAKKKKKGKKDDDDSEDEWRELEADMSRKKQPRPGQLENCEICNKRFTVTPYSKEGPDGGLLCTPCGKQAKLSDAKLARENKKKAPPGRKRRQVESNRLDGLVHFGTKRLAQLCIETIVKHHDDVEEFGDLPDDVLTRLSEIFSKRRVLTPQTLPLFLRPDLHELVINDAAYLNQEDFCRIFSESQQLRKVVLRNAGQLKNNVIDHMTDKVQNLIWLQVYAANLVSNEKWIELFQAIGPQLQTVKLTWMDAAFDDGVVEAMVNFCPNLHRIKFKFCRQLTPACLDSLAKLQHLEHLSLQLSTSPEAEHLIRFLEPLAPRLKTLSLEGFYEVNDDVLAVLRTRGSSLDKLRLIDMDCASDHALSLLFGKTAFTAQGQPDVAPTVVPSLRFVDLSSARDVDNNNPTGPVDAPIGLAAGSFVNLMKHSGPTLQTLRIASCRHIPFEGFGDAFSPAKRANAYPQLREVNVSFCSAVDENVVQGIFAACPKIERCIAFGCFGIGDVMVPAGVALIGVPRAQDAIEKVGDWKTDVKGKKAASGFLDELSGMAPVGLVGA